LKALIREGVLKPVKSKAVMRNEIAVMTAGFPITRVPYGAATTLYAWADRSTDVQAG
jgi:hypothetical protein